MKKDVVLTLGGLDPSGGAGILADQEILGCLQVPSIHLMTANTCQVEGKFFSYQLVSKSFLRGQLFLLGERYRPTIVKIGMLGSASFVDVLIPFLKTQKHVREIIWDPLWKSSSGFSLIDKQTFSGKLKTFLKHVTLLAPNLPEAKWILGKSEKRALSIEQICRDLGIFSKNDNLNILLKGGHLKGKAIDTLYHESQFFTFKSKRISGDFHGSGCRFGSAIAAYLFKGEPLVQSIKKAKKFLNKQFFISKSA